MPRRHQLRGPFGQMLMEEMAKSDLKQQVAILHRSDSDFLLRLKFTR